MKVKSLVEMQSVSHSVFFCLKVTLVVLVGRNFDGYVLDNGKSIGFQTYTLHGVVGDEAHLGYSDAAKYLGTNAIIAFVCLMSQTNVGIYGVHTVDANICMLSSFP